MKTKRLQSRLETALFQTSPKKLIGQYSEGDVLSLVGDRTGFADFAQFVHEEESCVDGGQPRRHGAFEVYRKPVSSKRTLCNICSSEPKWQM